MSERFIKTDIMQEIVKEIRDVLSEVKYPGTSKSIVALDMVQNIKAETVRWISLNSKVQ